MRASERAAASAPTPVVVRGGFTRVQRIILVVIVVILGVLVALVLGQAASNGQDVRRVLGISEGLRADNDRLIALLDEAVREIDEQGDEIGEQGDRIAILEAALRTAGVQVPGDPPIVLLPTPPAVVPPRAVAPRAPAVSGSTGGSAVAPAAPAQRAPAPLPPRPGPPVASRALAPEARVTSPLTSEPLFEVRVPPPVEVVDPVKRWLGDPYGRLARPTCPGAAGTR